MLKEKWSKGKHGGCVVSDTPNRHTRDDHVDYYGGHLIAESIPKQEYVNLIVCAPSMLALLEKALLTIDNPPFTVWPAVRDLANEIKAEIDKAYGREGKSDG